MPKQHRIDQYARTRDRKRTRAAKRATIQRKRERHMVHAAKGKTS